MAVEEEKGVEVVVDPEAAAAQDSQAAEVAVNDDGDVEAHVWRAQS